MSQAFHGGNLADAALRFKRPPHRFIDFSSNLNIWIEPKLPRAAAIQREVVRYPEAAASLLRQRLAEVYGIASSRLQPASGAAEALYLAMRLFSGQRVGVIEPGFSDYGRACQAAGIAHQSIVLAPDQWFQPLAAIENRFQNLDVIVLGNPNNPTGHLHQRTDLVATIRRFPKKSWVIDEAFIEFVEPSGRHSLLPLLKDLPSVIVIGSLTKSWRVPGLRLGFLATSRREWLEKTELWQPPWSLNGIAQLWAGHNLTVSGRSRMRRTLAALPALRKQLIAGLKLLPQLRVHPGRANFLLLELLEGRAGDLYDALGREGLLVRVCDSFSGVPPGRFIRVAIRGEKENRRLTGALDKFFRSASSPA